MNQLTQGPIWQISLGDGYAGSAKFALLTTEYLQNHGCDITIVVSTNSLTEKRATSRGLRTIPLDTFQSDGVVFERLKTVFEAERPRLIVSHHSLERKLSMRLKRKFKREFKNVAFRNIVASSLPLVSAVPYNLWFDYHIACSQGVARSLRRIGIRRRKIRTVHNGIEVPDQLPSRQGSRAQIVGRDDRKVIGLSTWFHPKRKGFDILCEGLSAFSSFPYNLLIVGPPIQHHESILSMARKYGIPPERLILPGYVESIWEYYAAMDVFVLPSRIEGFSLALLEAMVSRIPVVVSRIPGNDEVVFDGETGLLFDINHPHELASRIEQILRDHQLAERLSQAGRLLVQQNFTMDQVGDKYASVLEEMIAGR